jgi:acetylornithine deacetylase/succinyl-diaminopimelate desuccinylase-like protein
MNTADARKQIESAWEEHVLPALNEYIRIPNQSPIFDPEWAAAGHMDRAIELAAEWARGRKLHGARVEILRLEGRTPVLFLDVEASGGPGATDRVLLYGHLDKQPPFEGWREDLGLGPWTPRILDGKLYGRGASDDGYAFFAIVTAIEVLQAQRLPHPRLVALVECSEESGSVDLPAYVESYAEQIGEPDLVICLDSGCGDYERLWTTTSLRGMVGGDLTVTVLTEGVHSGDGSGIVASSFRILRLLLDRLEDASTGRILPQDLHVTIPELRIEQARATAKVLGRSITGSFPFVRGMRPVSDEGTELLLNRSWRPALSITGAAGLPTLEQSGNVLRPFTAAKISLRIPPTLDAKRATAFVKQLFESDPPYGAAVSFEGEKSANGWEAPAPERWLSLSLERASSAFFGKPPCDLGEGGSIPFMAMLGERFPKAQFLITGVLGPQSNAHGPNEFLHLATARSLTGCVAQVIADFAAVRR